MSCLLRHATSPLQRNFARTHQTTFQKPEPSHDRKEFRWETSKRMNTDRAVEPAIRSAGIAIFLWSSSLANFFFWQIISALCYVFFFYPPKVIQAVSPPSNQSHNSCCGVKKQSRDQLSKERGGGEFFLFQNLYQFFLIAKAFIL